MANIDDATLDREIFEQQRLAQAFEPEVVGPLVDLKRSIHCLVFQYRDADEIYKLKLGNLLQSRPFYRPMKGDGSCGWRAMLFSYFEGLLLIGDPGLIDQERARLADFEKIIKYERYIYEEWLEAILNLLDEVKDCIVNSGDGRALLERAFNDEQTSLNLIQFLRTITSSWMKIHTDEYAPYLTEPYLTIDEYTAVRVEPYAAEMAELSLKASYDALVGTGKSGMVLEIRYLDRSPGDTVNVIMYEPSGVSSTGPQLPGGSVGRPTICLLYRPGHYDVLYAS